MRLKLLILSLFLTVALVACGGDSTTDESEVITEVITEMVTEVLTEEQTAAVSGSADELPFVDPLDVSGDIVTAGSSTVFPLSEAMAERFRAEGYGGNITIDSIGSGAGYRALLRRGRVGHRQRQPPHSRQRNRVLQRHRPQPD